MRGDEQRVRSHETRLRTEIGRKNIVGEQVRIRRKASGLTSEELAEIIQTQTESVWSVGRQDIYKLERGVRAVTDIEIVALAKALGCDPCDLFLRAAGVGDDKEDNS